MSMQVSYKKQFVFFLMLLVVLFVSIEGFARVYEHYNLPYTCDVTKSEANQHLDINFRKQLCRDFREMAFYNEPIHHLVPNQHLPTININQHGLRGPEFSIQKPDNTYRIFVLGGSTAFGAGATSDKATIPSYLQQRFDSENLPVRVQVINAGIPFINSYEESRLVKEKYLEFDPDLFIVYDGWNDISRPPIRDNGTHVDFGEKYGTKEKRFLKEGATLIAKKIIPPGSNTTIFTEKNEDSIEEQFTQNLKAFLHNIKAIRVLQTLPDDMSRAFEESDFVIIKTPPRVQIVKYGQENTELKVSLWEERWKEICRLGKIHDFNVIITVQPIVGSSNRTLSPFEDAAYIRQNNEQKLIVLDSLAMALGNFDRDCIKTADLRKIFDGINEPVYTDAVHMVDFGNEIVAQNIFEIALPIVSESIKNN